MRRTILTALALGALVGSPAFAQQAQHEHGKPAQGAQAGGMMDGSADMEAHRAAMQEMHGLMQRAKAATDPAERARLMAEHREKMQAHMAHMMQGGNAKMMQQHHERMAMMHEMMAEMAAHHAAEQAQQPVE